MTVFFSPSVAPFHRRVTGRGLAAYGSRMLLRTRIGVALAVGLAAVAGVVVYERNGLAIQSMLAASRPAVAPAG